MPAIRLIVLGAIAAMPVWSAAADEHRQAAPPPAAATIYKTCLDSCLDHEAGDWQWCNQQCSVHGAGEGAAPDEQRRQGLPQPPASVLQRLISDLQSSTANTGRTTMKSCTARCLFEFMMFSREECRTSCSEELAEAAEETVEEDRYDNTVAFTCSVGTVCVEYVIDQERFDAETRASFFTQCANPQAGRMCEPGGQPTTSYMASCVAQFKALYEEQAARAAAQQFPLATELQPDDFVQICKHLFFAGDSRCDYEGLRHNGVEVSGAIYGGDLSESEFRETCEAYGFR